ncbi:MAG: PHP domain-containing protein [Candidatus Verstraetearchaeota archaeon]|nr:PHP domain-containing protein [Candidatus Verstraetearchaeota archaeon]
MQLKLDLHVHTWASRDGVSSLEEVLRAASRKGLDGIAITDHDQPFPMQLAEKLSRETELLVVPGVEITTRQGHLIALGFEELVKPMCDALAAGDLIKSAGGVLVVPHPFDKYSHGVGEELAVELEPHAVEVCNASTWRRYNRRAAELSRSRGIPGIAGSDAHHWRGVGRAYTVVEVEEPSIEEVLKAIRRGRVRAVEGYLPISVSILTLACRVLRAWGRRP